MCYRAGLYTVYIPLKLVIILFSMQSSKLHGLRLLTVTALVLSMCSNLTVIMWSIMQIVLETKFNVVFFYSLLFYKDFSFYSINKNSV